MSDAPALFTINVTSTRGVIVNFLFKAQDRALRVYLGLKDTINPDTTMEDRGLDVGQGQHIDFEDDFGTRATIDTADVMWVTMIDILAQMKGQEEMQIAGARANHAAQTRAAADPTLRPLNLSGGVGAPIFNPNGRRGN